MWAGSEIEFHSPIIIGEHASKKSQISDIKQKLGKSGELVFVTVEHETEQSGKLCLTERQTIVFREAAKESNTTDEPSPKPTEPIQPKKSDFSVPFSADPTLLFRYSAATFNAHRIHYDRDYSVQQENYPGLLVHGPLLATLLMERLSRHVAADIKLKRFDFRAQTPVYDLTPFLLCGEKSERDVYQLWVETDTATSCLQASARIEAS